MIDTLESLNRLIGAIQKVPWVAMDTEADSLHAYPEKVCLIQITTPLGDELVDPLAGLNLQPFLEALKAHELIFHAADYDLRLLWKHHRFLPSTIFDTMLAARLLGERQFGLGHLVQKFLGITLDKGSQKADWARRPLTEKMIAYARNDTHFLKDLADVFGRELNAKGRLAWHQESCQRQINEASELSEADPEKIWRIKGSAFLDRPALAVLRELWRWREGQAIESNRPPFFILSHETMVDLSRAAASGSPLDRLIPQRMHPRRRETLASALRKGLATPSSSLPPILRHTSKRPSEQEFQRFREIEKIRDQQASALGLDPTLIASKAVLGDLARDWDGESPKLMSWQRNLLQTLQLTNR